MIFVYPCQEFFKIVIAYDQTLEIVQRLQTSVSILVLNPAHSSRLKFIKKQGKIRYQEFRRYDQRGSELGTISWRLYNLKTVYVLK